MRTPRDLALLPVPAALENVLEALLDEAERVGMPSSEMDIRARAPARVADELLEKTGIDSPPVHVEQLVGYAVCW